MESLTKNLELHIPENLFLKNPRESALGQRLIRDAAEMIAKLGIEHFNFKKLSAHSQCTEATVYRYFENKHKLLLYILNIYWGWQEYAIVFATSNVSDPHVKLQKVCEILADPRLPYTEDRDFSQNLLLIAVKEGVKIHLTTTVKDEISDGSMKSYYRLVQRLAKMIRETNTHYPYPVSLAASIMDIALQQIFYSLHNEDLTDVCKDRTQLTDLLTHLLPGNQSHG